ncbi:MAG TPA: transcriptional regulator, partial [Sphingomonas sp.]|nr:transcriptional regulator [Sphingomonas sp.]
MPKLELDTLPLTNRTGYPAPFDQPVQGRWYRRLAPAGGLTH